MGKGSFRVPLSKAYALFDFPRKATPRNPKGPAPNHLKDIPKITVSFFHFDFRPRSKIKAEGANQGARTSVCKSTGAFLCGVSPLRCRCRGAFGIREAADFTKSFEKRERHGAFQGVSKSSRLDLYDVDFSKRYEETQRNHTPAAGRKKAQKKPTPERPKEKSQKVSVAVFRT
ncbi:hypothetical protein LSM04_006191 [Trypanosoma melophagium]|uniref:uncharacterized protein n=1 Tax=Trypanosoma melophagium TaxID=715481 RepID=UPI00351A95EB|nr:hypothetical protein LSM04_006191 [Trypanosoma melophagium]